MSDNIQKKRRDIGQRGFCDLGKLIERRRIVEAHNIGSTKLSRRVFS